MVELTDLFKQQSPGSARDQSVLSGKLIKQGGKDYLKVDLSTKLWGPIRGAEALSHGDEIVVGIDQLSVPYVIFPNGSGGAGPLPGGGVYSTKIGNGSATSFAVNHGLGSKDVLVALYRTGAPGDEITCDVEHTSTNTITIRTLSPPSSNEYTVVVMAAGGAGGGGTGGGDKNYVHTQIVSSTTWTVLHNLGKYPAVEVVNSGGNVLIPDVHYDSVDQVTLTFGTTQDGKAYVN